MPVCRAPSGPHGQKQLLGMVQMEERMDHMPNELSGGQKQRVAIARAMANDPAIILADEPTGALDSSTGRLVMDLFHKLHREQGKTIVLITHNQELAEETQRIVTIRDGQVVDVRAGSQVLPEESIYCHGNSAATGEGGSV